MIIGMGSTQPTSRAASSRSESGRLADEFEGLLCLVGAVVDERHLDECRGIGHLGSDTLHHELRCELD